MKNILVVDDEKEIADLIALVLKNEGYNITVAYDGKTAKDYINCETFDLALLDVMLPDIDGFSLCSLIRQSYYYPIIMVTAKIADFDKITGLTIGADDYITKPFNPLELVTRVKSQLRRYTRYNKDNNDSKDCIEIRGLSINVKKHSVTLNDQPIELTPLEFEILTYLAQHINQVVSSEALFEAVWKEKFFNSNNTVMAHIARLREKLHEPSRHPKYIKTVWGVGYRIDE